VINRGAQRARIFFNAHDYRAFLEVLAETVDRYELPLLAYCVMPNHWHLVVRPESQQMLSTSVQWLTGTHAVRWCRAHQRDGCGPLYQGRFKSIPVQANVSLARVCRYVERNAQAKQMVARAEDWPWSSAYQRCRNGTRPALTPLEILSPAAWLRFINESPKDVDVATAILLSRPFGDEEWLKARGVSLTPALRGRPRKGRTE
jgi:putative transposase